MQKRNTSKQANTAPTVSRTDFQRFLNAGGYCTPPGRAACALSSARTLAQWREFEAAGLVRLRAVAEEENYFDVYGKPDDEREYKAICEQLERDGVWQCRSQYWDGSKWVTADSIGMCAGYNDPLSPFENSYIPDLMSAALENVSQEGEH
jgi:hypothetical protein